MTNLRPTTAIACKLDYTCLRLDMGENDVKLLCANALKRRIFAICTYPCYIELAHKLLAHTPVRLASVAGFPHGRASLSSKLADIQHIAKQKADEVDIVINYSLLIERRLNPLKEEVKELVSCCKQEGLTSKIIVETCYLTTEKKLLALELCEACEADFIKTSTGFGSHGAQLKDIEMWTQKRRGPIKIKASGGIKTHKQALAMIQAGADRLGVSNAIAILEEGEESSFL